MKNLLIYYVLTFCVGLILFFAFKPSVSKFEPQKFVIPKYGSDVFVDHFYDDNLNAQINLSGSLANGTPVVFGSSELTSNHLMGVPYRYFNEVKHANLFAFGHAGFQNLAMLTVLAANKSILKNSRLLIILSPGWFEGNYAKGTSLASFFEFCPESYLYSIFKDTTLDASTKSYISNYINTQYEKIASPGCLHRIYAHRANKLKLFHKPFVKLNKAFLQNTIKFTDEFLIQETVLTELNKLHPQKRHLNCVIENWDSLLVVSKENFKKNCSNNSFGVANEYYSKWMSNGNKKEVHPVSINSNQELNDFKALIDFLKTNNIKPCFVITPLNTLAHDGLDKLEPAINEVKKSLIEGGFTYLDMFTPNLKNYDIGVLEDIMHPYDYGWYQINKFINQNMYCK